MPNPVSSIHGLNRSNRPNRGFRLLNNRNRGSRFLRLNANPDENPFHPLLRQNSATTCNFDLGKKTAALGFCLHFWDPPAIYYNVCTFFIYSHG